MNHHTRVGKSPRNRERVLEHDRLERPEPNFSLDPFHRVLRIVSVIVVVILPAYSTFRLPALGGELPMQSSFSGEVSRTGSAGEAIMSLLFLAVITVGLALLSRYPQSFNFLVPLTGDTIQEQYQNAVRMIIWIAAALALIGVVMTGTWLGLLPMWAIAVPLVALGGSLIFFIARMFRLR